MNVAHEFAELQQCNAALTKENANMKANDPEGWIPTAEALKQLEQQAEEHAAQLETLKTEHTSRIKTLESRNKELEIRLGKYKTAVDSMASIT